MTPYEEAILRRRNAIASIESAGSGGYSAVGPVTNGDRPYGRYQVMGKNIPQWTQQALGKALTPQEYLASPDAQNAVFDKQFGGYVNKYGEEGAAQAWIGGPGSVGQTGRTDILGTSVGAYGQRYMNAIGQPQMAAPSTEAIVNAIGPIAQQDADMASQQSQYEKVAVPDKASPFDLLAKLMAQQQQQTVQPEPEEPVRPRKQVDFAATSQTPNVYLERLKKLKRPKNA